MVKQSSRAKLYTQRLAAARGKWAPTDYSKHLLIPEKKILVLADVHLPRHDEFFLGDAFAKAEDEGVEAIVFLGDLMDMPTFSTWGIDDWSDNFERELEICETVIRCALQAAPTVYWSRGNHEYRFLRKMDQQLSMRKLAMLCELQDVIDSGRLIVSDHPSLDAFGGAWLLTHPKSYGSQPLVEPGRIATRFQVNVLSAHAHHWAQGLDQTGTFQVVESGGLFDPRFHRYIQENVTPHRAWVEGYWILDNGVPTGFRPSAQSRAKKSLMERIYNVA